MIYANDHAKCHALKFLIAHPIPCRHVCLFNIAHYDYFLTPHFVLVFVQSISFHRGVPPSSTMFHIQCSTSFSIHPVSWLCSQPFFVLSLQLLSCWLSRHPVSLNSQETLQKRWFIVWFMMITSSCYPGREQREIPTTAACRISRSAWNIIMRGLVSVFKMTGWAPALVSQINHLSVHFESPEAWLTCLSNI